MLDFDDLMSKRRYGLMRAYRQSKLANLLFARELQRRLEASKRSMLSIAVHPGLVATHMFTRFGDGFFPLRLLLMLFSWLAPDAEQGARPQLYAATAPDVVGGTYLVPNPEGRPKVGYSSLESRDPELAKRLWIRSEELTGLSFL
jgi:NAD(P)-dependent dehydrogenase (short-subunit alcohol dehydrogenase family)